LWNAFTTTALCPGKSKYSILFVTPANNMDFDKFYTNDYQFIESEQIVYVILIYSNLPKQVK